MESKLLLVAAPGQLTLGLHRLPALRSGSVEEEGCSRSHVEENPAAGSFVQFLVEKYSLKKLKEIYQRVDKAGGDAAMQASWVAVYGKSLRDLEGEWLTFLNTLR